MALLALAGFNSLFFCYLLQLSENFGEKSEQRDWRWDKKKSLVNKRIYFNNSPNPTTSEYYKAENESATVLTSTVWDSDSYEGQHNYCEYQIGFQNEERTFWYFLG